MGPSLSKQDSSFDPNDWQAVQIAQMKNNYQDQYTLVRNRKTGQFLDRYQLSFPSQRQYTKYVDQLDSRRENENIVRVIHYQPKIIKQFCGSSYLLNVYLQHCKSRFCQFQDIPNPDSLYCSLALLNGYQKLYRKIGRFPVSQNQIMIDQTGKIRVWLNSDFSSNQIQGIQQSPNILLSKNEQYSMVNDIMNIIFQSSDQSDDQNPIKFKDYYQTNKINQSQKIGFTQARNIIYQYAKNNNIQIPDVFTSVLNIYQQNQNQQQPSNQLNEEEKIIYDHQNSHINQQDKVGNYQSVNSLVSPPPPQPPPPPPPPPQTIIQNLYSQPGPYQMQSSRSGFNPPRYQPIKSTIIPGATIHINAPTNQSYIRPPTLNPNSARSIYPPPPPQSIITSSPSIHKIYYQAPITQQSQVSNYPLRMISQNVVNSTPMTPVSRGLSSQSSHSVFMTPQVFPASHQHQLYNNQGVSYAPQKMMINIPKQNFSISNQNMNNHLQVEAPSKNSHSQQQKKSKISLQQQQLQIQRKFILKKSTVQDQNINQSNIIRDLSELNKISQQQNSKKSNLQIQNIHYHNKNKHQNNHHHDDYQDKFSDALSKQIILDNDKNNQGINKINIKGVQLNSRDQLDQQGLGRQPSSDFNTSGLLYKQSNQSNPHYQSNSAYYQQPISSFQSHQINQQSYNASYPFFNSHQPQNIIPVNVTNQRNFPKRQFYYTLQKQIQIDPQIANDLSFYAKT